MPPKHDSGIWRLVQLKSELTVTGGKTNKSYVLVMDTMQLGDAEVKLVQTSSADGWLCEIVTGQVSSRRPLGRSGLFKLLKHLVAPAVADDIDDGPVTPDKMQDLAFDVADDSPPTLEPAEKLPKRRRGPQKYTGAIVKRIDVPENPCAVPAVAENGGGTAAAATRQLVAAVHCKKLLIDKDALSWLVHYLKVEYEAGSVPHPEHDDGEESRSSPGKSVKLWWDFRDDCWVGRYGGGSKTTPRKSKSVRSRIGPAGDLAHMTFADAKQAAYDELFEILSSGGDPGVEHHAEVAAGGRH